MRTQAGRCCLFFSAMDATDAAFRRAATLSLAGFSAVVTKIGR